MTRCSFVSKLAVLLPLSGMLACTQAPTPEKAEKLGESRSADAKSGDPAAAKVELQTLPAGPVAVVGGVEIPNDKFKVIYDLKVKKYADRGREIPATADRRYRKSIAERLVWNEVLAQEAKKLGVDYDAAELAKREEQQKRGIRDWDKHLERRGETEESLREMYIAELREQAILDKLGKLAVTAEEIQADYDKIKENWKSDKPRIRASHILVPITPNNNDGSDKPADATDAEKAKWEEAAKTEIDRIYALVSAEGGDFDKIAEEHSTGPSAQKGGDIGIFTADRMAEEFSTAAFAMETGQISKPVKTKFGWHIIKVTGKWPPGELPLSALEDQITDRLRQRKLHQGRRELKEELLGKYEIVDNIAPTLGPEPERQRKPLSRTGGNPHTDLAKVAEHGNLEPEAEHADEPGDKAEPEEPVE